MNDVNGALKHEDNMVDASYREKKGSKEPMMGGAFKGALASGLAARIIKPKGRLGEASLIGAGTTIGGILGQHDHTNKLRAKSKAKSELAKESEADIEDVRSLGVESLGAGAIGGLSGMAFAPKGRSRGKWGLISAGVSSAGGLIGGLTERGVAKAERETGNENTKGSLALAMGSGMAAEGAASPYIHKLIGGMKRNRNDRNLSKSLGEEIGDHHRGTGLLNRIGRGIGWMDEEKSMHEGMTRGSGSKFFNRKIGKRAFKGGLKQGLLGAGVGLGIEHLMS